MWRKSIFLVTVLAVHNLEAILQLKITPDIVFEGDRVTLQCNIYKTKVPPTEEVTWKHNGKEFNGTQDSLNLPRTFLINDARLDDAGTYTCSNDLYESTASLIVIKPIRIVNWKANYEVKAENSVTIRCNVETDERLEFETKWFKGTNMRQPIENNSKFVITDDSLTILNVSPSDIGDYICEVKTVVDAKQETTKLTLDEIPHAPILSNFGCYSTVAEISWQPSENYGSDIESYKIEYNTAFDPDNWNTAEENVSADVSKSVIELYPWTNYTFRVIAINKIGASPPSELSHWCLSKPDFPYKNPDGVQGEGTEPTNLVISWTPMPPSEQNGDEFFYRVSWKRDIPGEDWNTRSIRDWQQSNITIDDQPTFVKYLIKVEAINYIDRSNATAIEYVGYSGEGIPVVSPANLRVNHIRSTIACLSWNHVSLKAETLKGHYKGYKIQFWNDVDGKDNNLTALWFHNQYELDELRPATHYYVQVCVMNGQFDGPISDVLEFNTAEDVPSIVQSFKTSASNSSALTLQWVQPEHPNGNLTGYNIYCEEIGKGPVLQPLFVVDPQAIEITVDDLEPDTKYRLYIAATTAVGEGERASIEAKTQPAGTYSSTSPNSGSSTSTGSFSSSTNVTKPNSSSSISGNVMLVMALVATMVAVATSAF